MRISVRHKVYTAEYKKQTVMHVSICDKCGGWCDKRAADLFG